VHPGVPMEDLEGLDAVGDDGEVLGVRQVAGEDGDGRRGVHADADAAAGHQRHELAGDRLLGRTSPSFALLEGLRATHGASSHPADDTLLLERLQVAADGHRADPEAVGQLVDAQRAVDGQQLGQGLTSALDVDAAPRHHDGLLVDGA